MPARSDAHPITRIFGAPRRRLLVVAALMLLGVLTVTALNVEVVREGRILPTYDDPVYEISVFGHDGLYVDAEGRRVDSDILNGFLLAAIAAVTLVGWLLLRRVGVARSRTRIFLGLACLGATLLTADEILGLHETVGHNLPMLADLPGIGHSDDAVFALWVVPATAFVWAFHDLLFSSRRGLLLFGAGVALFLVALAFDVGQVSFDLEGKIEALASLVLALGFVLLVIDLLARELAADVHEDRTLER